MDRLFSSSRDRWQTLSADESSDVDARAVGGSVSQSERNAIATGLSSIGEEQIAEHNFNAIETAGQAQVS
jgi:hypothetical protein